ncbi:MAG: helix-turn-helix transcriptional regulator [Clostridia bacterium]|nr:helix-turn-helix transcriptional regulator [Clostridia bacterium]
MPIYDSITKNKMQAFYRIIFNFISVSGISSNKAWKNCKKCAILMPERVKCMEYELADKIDHLCREKGISRGRLAALSGISRITLKGIMDRTNTSPRIQTVYALARAFDMSLTEFLSYTVPESSENQESAADA